MTSLAHAFVHAIIPRQVDDNDQAAIYDLTGIIPGECVYCGSKSTDLDHFKALVKGGKPSGYFHRADNIVPSCGPCNQSKSGSNWRAWMTGKAKGSPATRGVSDVEVRIERLAIFETLVAGDAVSVDEMREASGRDLWDAYWHRLARLRTEMQAAEEEAVIIRQRLAKRFLVEKSSAALSSSAE